MLWTEELEIVLNKKRFPRKIGSGLGGGYVNTAPVRYSQPAALVSVSTFYLLSGSIPSGLTLPSSVFGSWNNTGSLTGSGAVLLGTSPGTSQASVQVSVSGVAKSATKTLCHAQFCSVALAAGSYSAGTWTFAFAARQSTIDGTNGSWIGRAALFLVNGSDGSLRTTIFSTANIGASRTTVGSELTCYSASISGGAFSPTAGDYLCFEYGCSVRNGDTSAITITSTTYDSGTTAITSDNVGTSDAQSLITSPVAITLQ